MKFCILSFLFIQFLFVKEASTDTLCPDNWTAFRGSCYLFAHVNSNFLDAERFCAHRGGHLVHVNDATENAFLKSFLSDLKDPIHWIGLTDEVTEGIWIWYDTNMEASYTNWHNKTSEPNGGKAENCVYISADQEYNWVDAPCSWERKPLCEKREQDGSEIVGKRISSFSETLVYLKLN